MSTIQIEPVPNDNEHIVSTPRENLDELRDSFLNLLGAIWNYVVDIFTEPVMIGGLVLALIIVVVGRIVNRLLAVEYISDMRKRQNWFRWTATGVVVAAFTVAAYQVSEQNPGNIVAQILPWA